MSEIEEIKTEVARLNRRLGLLVGKEGQQRRNPNFPRELRDFLDHHKMSQSDFAAEIWGRTISSEGKNVAKGKDRVSVWLRGISYPSKMNMQKILAMFVKYL